MNRQRRLWAQVTGHLFDELVGIHHRAHTAFGHKLGCTHAFPLFQGKRSNRTIFYNAEYHSSGKLRRGVLFITTGSNARPASSEQWSIGRGWGQWSPDPKHLERLARRVYDAVADEWNIDLAPLKIPIKLVDWINGLAMEFAHRSSLPPDHPVLTKCLQRIFVRGGHETVGQRDYELPHEGLGGDLAAYALAACRIRVDLHWEQVFAMPGNLAAAWPKAPQLWIDLAPEANEGAALGFPPPYHHADNLPPGGIQLALYPRPGDGNSVDNALRIAADLTSPSLYQTIDTFPSPKYDSDLASWRETLHAIGRSGHYGNEIWNLTQPDTLEATRQTVKAWDRTFSRWGKALIKSA